MPLRIYRTYKPGVPQQPTEEVAEPPPSVPANVLVADDGKPIVTDDLKYIEVEP